MAHKHTKQTNGRKTLIKADLHIHTTFSYDSLISPKTLIEQLVGHPYINVAAITDHDTTDGITTTLNLAKPYPDILIIPGVEISTPDGDIIVLGTQQLPPKPWSITSVVDFAKKNDFISIAAHPYREWGLGDLTPTSNVDAIEVLNGASSSQANKKARQLAKSLNLPAVAGSDSHKPSELFNTYTEINASLNASDILKAIKKGHVKPISNKKSIHF